MTPTKPTSQSENVHDSVLVEVPARTEYAATLRLMVASFGADTGFSVDEIDDLRLGVNEVFSAATDGDGERVAVRFTTAAGNITVRLSTGAPIEFDQLATTILHSVVDAVEVDGGTVTLRKSATDRR